MYILTKKKSFVSLLKFGHDVGDMSASVLGRGDARGPGEGCKVPPIYNSLHQNPSLLCSGGNRDGSPNFGRQ